MIEQAKAHAMRVHEGQHDRDGRPHIEHVQRVADAVARADGDDPEAVMVAYLHDVIEDKAEESEQTLRAAGFPEPVTAAVTLLSRPNQGAVVNVVAVILVLASIIPVYVSQRIGGDSEGGGRI